MEHSRLLRFLQRQVSISDMAEAPSFKVQIDYQKPENVEAEVPGSQEIRKVDTDNVAEVMEGDITLSPVITVTKKESAWTKGDLKLQKVTVTEDIALEEIQNGGQSKITRIYHNTMHKDGRTLTRITSTSESNHGHPAIEDKQQEDRKSKIPTLKFRQSVEKVKKDRRSKQKPDDEVPKRPRKSSIPKLNKDNKTAIKKHEATPESKELAPEDEFERIYEEIADKDTDIDDKALSIKLEDTEKLESKFEELMHSYEDEDNVSVVQVEKLRQSKIPALRRRKVDGDGSKLSSIVNNIRMQNAVRNSREFPIENEFGEVTTKTITTKRFGRVNSRETVMTVDANDDSNDNNASAATTQRVIKESTRITKPLVKTVTRTEKVLNLDSNDGDVQDVSVTVDDEDASSDNNAAVIKTQRIIKESTRITKPVVTTITRSEKITNLDTNDNHVREISVTDDVDNVSSDNTGDVFKTQRIIKESTRIVNPMVSTVTRTKKNMDLASNNNEVREIPMTADAEDVSNDDTEDMIRTQQFIKQSTRIATPVVSTVARTGNITKISTIDDNNSDINQAITSHRIVTKRTLVPEVIEVTNAEKVVVTTSERNNNDVQDSTAKSIARERIIREINKVKSPVITEVTDSSVVNNIDSADNNQYTITRTELIDVGSNEKSRGFDNDTNDTTTQTKDNIETNYTFDIINNDANRHIKQTERVTKITKVGTPVLTNNKLIKVVSTQTSVNSESNKELGKTEIVKESIEISSSKEASTQNNNNDTSTAQDGATNGVLVTEQIVREGVKIGIPLFTKVTDETSNAASVSVSDDMKDSETERVKDNVEIIHSQVNVQAVEINKSVDDHENGVSKVYDGNYIKSSDKSVINKIANREMDITNTIISLKTESKQTKDESIEPTIDITHKEITIITDKKETKPNIIDVTSQSEVKHSDTLLQDTDGDTEEVTVLKGNVSRLINKLVSTDTRDTNKETQNVAEIDTVKQDRIRRLDKMISDFNKVDFKNVDAKVYTKESNNQQKEDSVVSSQKEVGEEGIILKGNVNRIINKLGVNETETILNRVVHNVSNKNDENINEFDDKYYLKLGPQDISNTTHVNAATVVTVIKKENVDENNLTHAKDNTDALETTNEVTESIKEGDTNVDFKDEIEDSRTSKLDKEDSTDRAIVNSFKKDIADSGSVVLEKDSEDVIRGSVSRLINKITTKEIVKSETVTNDSEKEIPKKKTVLSKIAIFERLEPKESYPPHSLPRSENKLSKLVAKDINISEKPRIVDEVLKDHSKFNPNNIDNIDGIAIKNKEAAVSTEPIIVNEIRKTSFNKDRTIQNVSVSQRQEKTSFTTHNNTIEISTDIKNNIEDTRVKVINEESSTESARSNIHFISDKDNTQNEITDDSTENSKQIYDRVKHKYDTYEQNAITISQELNRSESREYSLQINRLNFENGATTAEVAGEFKFDYPILKSEDIKQVNDGNTVQTTEYVTDDYTFGKPSRFMSKEDYGRARSVAETDLGDAVRGQVNRMVGRMRSVDFEKASDVIKTEKISIKEMPRSRSVLEKIALFEGKTATAKLDAPTERAPRVTKKAPILLTTEEIIRERTTLPGMLATAKMEITTEMPSKIAAKPMISEEMYQEKISELEAAKSLYQPVEVSTMSLGNGAEMPVIALGTALLDPRLIPQIIGTAIDLGYRAIDTAYIYGNEKAIGDAVKAKIDDGTVKREELFIMSKLWSTFHRGDLVETACKATLSNLGLTYIDLFMIHNPMSFKEGGDPIPRIATVLQYSEHDYLDAWFAMEKLVAQGLVRSIGVSNFNSSQIQRILDKGRVKPVVNQVECHPYLSQERLDDFCVSRNITLSCFGVLGSKGTPAEYKTSLAPVIDDPLVQVMAHGLNVTPAQLLIRYQIQSGHNVVVKSSTATHLKDNLDALNFTLSEPQMKALHALNKNKRMFTFLGMGETHKHYPFAAAF